MISFLSGTIQAISAKYIIVDVHGVGYRVVLPEKMLSSIAKIGEEIKIFTHFRLNPRDGEVELFGFATPEELNFFELLTSISGIGPKSAQAILSKSDLQPLQMAIIGGDEVYLTKVAGLGPKTSQRLILELKEKIKGVSVSAGTQAQFATEGEAIEALIALGYSQFQARDALKQVPASTTKVEDKITAALKLLAKK